MGVPACDVIDAGGFFYFSIQHLGKLFLMVEALALGIDGDLSTREVINAQINFTQKSLKNGIPEQLAQFLYFFIFAVVMEVGEKMDPELRKSFIKFFDGSPIGQSLNRIDIIVEIAVKRINPHPNPIILKKSQTMEVALLAKPFKILYQFSNRFVLVAENIFIENLQSFILEGLR